MAADADADTSPPSKKPPRQINKKKKKEEMSADHPCSLPWTQSIPSDDHFSLLLSSSEGVRIGSGDVRRWREALHKSKKRKRRRGDDDSGDGFSVPEEVAAHVEELESRGKSGDEKKKKKEEEEEEAENKKELKIEGGG